MKQYKYLRIPYQFLLIGIAIIIQANGLLAQKGNLKKAEEYLKKGDYTNAIPLLKQAQENKKTSSDATTWMLTGQAYLTSYQYNSGEVKLQALQEAHSAYQKAKEVDPTLLTTKPCYNCDKFRQMSNLFFQQGVNYYNQKLYEKSAELFKTAVDLKTQIGTTDSLATYNTGLAYEHFDKETAIEWYSKCVNMGYNKLRSYYNIIYLYANDDNLAKAKEVCAKAIQDFPDDTSLQETKTKLDEVE